MIQTVVIVAAAICAIAEAQIATGVGVAYGYYIPVNNNNNNQTNQTKYGWVNPNNPPTRGYNQPSPNYNQPPPQYHQPAIQYNQPPPQYNQSAYIPYPPTNQASPPISQLNPFDIAMGSRENGDTILFKTIIRKSPSWYTSSVSKVISFPDKSSHAKIQKITQIIVHDNKLGKGGYTKVVDGGVGRNFVNFMFKNNDNLSIDKQLEIYGFDSINRRFKK